MPLKYLGVSDHHIAIGSAALTKNATVTLYFPPLQILFVPILYALCFIYIPDILVMNYLQKSLHDSSVEILNSPLPFSFYIMPRLPSVQLTI